MIDKLRLESKERVEWSLIILQWLEINNHDNGHHQLLISGITSVDEITVTINTSPKCFSDIAYDEIFHGGINLRGRQFVFSRTMNTFLLVGCNFTDSIVNEEKLWGGCVSVCDGDIHHSQSACYGIECCQTSIPRQVKSLNLTITRLNYYELGYWDFCLHRFLVA